MNKILALAALLVSVTSSVHAITFAELNNSKGGKILLTNDVCTGVAGQPLEGLYAAQTFDSEGVTTEGCFHLDKEANVIRMMWKGPAGIITRTYPVDALKMIATPKTQKGSL